jgi:hypothetical protein
MKICRTKGADRVSSAEYKSARAKYLDSVSRFGNIYRIPTGQSHTPTVKLKKQQLALGLDLKGGMSAVLQVDLGGLFEVFGRQKQQQCGLPESAGKCYCGS